MRVGLVCPYSLQTPGGVQNHVLGLAGYLTAHGHQVSVLAPGRADPDQLLRDGLRLEQLTSAGRAVPVAYNGSIARVNFGPISGGRVARWLRRGRFDLVHLHEPITPSISLSALFLSARFAADTPVVATFHTATPRSRTMEVAGRVLGRQIDRIDAGIAVSQAARTVVVQHLGRDALVIPNGFRSADFTPATSFAGPAGPDPSHSGALRRPPRIAFLGRLDEPRKGLDVLLAALPAIRAVHPELEVLVAGQGRRHLPAGVTGLGRIDDRSRAALLAGADLFIAPHLARESFGIVLIEAMASATTVIASDLPPFVDLLSDPGSGELGYLFSAGDAAGLARAAVLALAEDRTDLIARAAATTRRYDWERVGAEILSVYRQVVQNSRRTLAQLPSGSELPEPRPALLPADLLDGARRALRLAADPRRAEPDRSRAAEAAQRVLRASDRPARTEAAARLSELLAELTGVQASEHVGGRRHAAAADDAATAGLGLPGESVR